MRKEKASGPIRLRNTRRGAVQSHWQPDLTAIVKASVKRLTYFPPFPPMVKRERLRPFEHGKIGKMKRVCHGVGSVGTLHDAQEHLPHEKEF